jgi:hypothetical protein
MTVLLRDDDTVPFQVTDANDAPANISGATVTMYVLTSQFDDDDDALIEQAGTLTNPTTGLGSVTLPRELKETSLLGQGTYTYRLQLVEAAGTDTTIRRGPYRVIG